MAAGTGSAPASTSAASPGSLIGRVPATLFDRARAELRSSAAAGGFAGAAAASVGSGVIRRAEDAPMPTGSAVPAAQGAGEQRDVRDSLTSREWDQLVDEVVRRIESRVTGELARRGRRFTPRMM
jgi:hypothetical protein